MTLDTFNALIGVGAIALQILAVVFFIAYALRNKYPDLGGIRAIASKWGMWIGFVVTSIAIVLSLVHSVAFGLAPCPLCYWQRIFIYPQAALFAVALWRRDVSIALYSIVLSVIGLCFAIYHHVLQTMPSFGLPCPAEGASCTQILFLEYGYVTYPMLSISLFAFLIATMLFVRNCKQD